MKTYLYICEHEQTMAQTIPYLRWRERINDITPANYRIGNDVIVIPQHPMLDLPTGCFKVDVTTMTIQQIADTLHFPSQSVFGKYFKRVTGLSPREYRNRI